MLDTPNSYTGSAALHHSPIGSVRQVCQPLWRHVCCCEGRQFHPLPQLEPPPVPVTGWRGLCAVRRIALLLRSSLAESRRHALPCVRPAKGYRHLSSSEEASLRRSVLRSAIARSPSPAGGHHYTPERPQREAAGQIHNRNRHARTHHRLRDKAAIVYGRCKWLMVS